MRLAYYAGVSTAAAAACLLKAFHERPNFYSASVYLSQSNACLLILTNLLLVLACGFMYGLQRLLYGPLRPIEIEQLSEKAWYAVLDTLLAMPSFREDVGGWLLAMFTLLLAGKVWGWIGEGKVDVLEQQPPSNPRLFHARLATSLIVSLLFDLWMLDYCIETVLADPRPGMMVIFTFEFAILSVSSSFTFTRYLLSVIQLQIEKRQMKKAILDRKNEIVAERAAARQQESAEGQTASTSPPDEETIEVDENEVDVPGWEEKRRYLFALEVFTDFFKLMIYIVFFTVSITFNGLPMHIMRDVYMTFASFSKRVSNYVAYRKATSDMNTRYPDATTEEIRGDACIVCRESMVAWEPSPVAGAPNGQAQPATEQPPQAAPPPTSERRRDEGLRAKKLPCGHILHLRCLKAWLERQQVCPTCRSPVVPVRETAGAAQGQQGAAGGANANPPAAGQQQDQQAQRRQGRARILNLGPLRIGFLNGPGDQINNLLRQMQNPQQAQAAGQDAANQAANQQGPNHLGLQVPYPQDAQPSAPTGESIQTQIVQLERRLMNEAQSLGLQQQQLATLRSMEQEVERLRALQHPALAPFPAPTRTHPLPAPLPFHLQPMQVPGQMPMHPAMLQQQSYPPFANTAFHGNPSQQYSNGHELLPPGMTLPEGWTVMPLRRADGTGGVRTNAPPQPTAPQTSQAPANEAPPDTNTDQTVGPTTDNGSPLFVPTVPAVLATSGTEGPTAISAASPAPIVGGLQADEHTSFPSATAPQTTSESQPDETRPAPAASPTPTTTTSNPDGERKAPWNSESWSFVDPPNGHISNGTTSDAAPTEPSQANGVAQENEERKYEGKGKGKAAAVEDVPDSDA